MEDGSCWKYSTKDNWTKIVNFLCENETERIVQLDSSDELHVFLSDTGAFFLQFYNVSLCE